MVGGFGARGARGCFGRASRAVAAFESATTALGAVFGGFAPLTRVAPSKPVSTTLFRLGSFTSMASSACLRRMRSSRAMSSFADVRTFMTMRITMASAEIDSRPQTSGFSSTRERHLPDCASSVAVRSISASTASTSASYGTARSRMTRAQPCDMLPTRRISPFRTNQSVPFTSRTFVMRICTSSTMPVAGPEVDDVADAELVFDDHEQAVEHVLHDVLGAEAEAGADRGGQQRERAQDRRVDRRSR